MSKSSHQRYLHVQATLVLTIQNFLNVGSTEKKKNNTSCLKDSMTSSEYFCLENIFTATSCSEIIKLNKNLRKISELASVVQYQQMHILQYQQKPNQTVQIQTIDHDKQFHMNL